MTVDEFAGEAMSLAMRAWESDTGRALMHYLAELEGEAGAADQAILDRVTAQATAKTFEAAQMLLGYRDLIGADVDPDPDTVAMLAVTLLGNPGIDPDEPGGDAC